MSQIIHLKDAMTNKTTVDYKQGGLWAKTEIIGGYDFIDGKEGVAKSTLGEVLFTGSNIVTIGGVTYVMQNMFNVPNDQFELRTLYDQTTGDSDHGGKIGRVNSATITTSDSQCTYDSPTGTETAESKTIQYRPGHFVQLFGLGYTGVENDVSIYPCDYREDSINIHKTDTDNRTVDGQMLPLRYTTTVLDQTERAMYFGKRVENGVTAYYLKKFEKDPEIRHIWNTGEEINDEELVSSDEVWTNTSGLNAVETYTEMVLKITPKDLKEYFISIEQPDKARFNTIALYSGRFVQNGSNDVDNYGDYEDIILFSKLCINPEYVDLNKELTIIYRVYGS